MWIQKSSRLSLDSLLPLTGVHFWGKSQHVDDVSQQKIKCRRIRSWEIGGASLSDVLYIQWLWQWDTTYFSSSDWSTLDFLPTASQPCCNQSRKCMPVKSVRYMERQKAGFSIVRETLCHEKNMPTRPSSPKQPATTKLDD